jgi:4-hydroxy-2-oxoheptanedioate aldolase
MIMPTFLTAREIKEYHARGLTSLLVDQMPVLTDEAREVAKKLNFEVKLKASEEPRKTEPLSAPAGRRISFKERLRTGRKTVGTFIQIAHPVMTEFVGKLGFDYVLIDSEHAAMHIETVQAMLQGLASTPTYGVVRIPTISPEYIAATLDAGADAILVPQVRTPEDVAAIQSAALYPPEGKRGIGPGRATGFGLRIFEKKVAPNRDTAVIIQIETKEAIENLEAILAFEFFDMVFVGPGDLSMNLGIFGEFSHPLLVEQVERVIKKAREYEKKVGIFAGNVEMAVHWLRQGVDLVTLNSELGLMAQFIKKNLEELQAVLNEG